MGNAGGIYPPRYPKTPIVIKASGISRGSQQPGSSSPNSLELEMKERCPQRLPMQRWNSGRMVGG